MGRSWQKAKTLSPPYKNDCSDSTHGT